MRIIQALVGEHGALGAILDHLEQNVPVVGGLWELRAQVCLLRSVLSSQMTIEDELLFSGLEYAIWRDGPLAALRIEHSQIMGALTWAPQLENLDEAKRFVLETVDLIRQNLAKKQEIVFPLAQEKLHPDLLEKLGYEWAERRGLEALVKA